MSLIRTLLPFQYNTRANNATRLIGIRSSMLRSKKWAAVFIVNNKTKIVNFGARGMDDFTITHNRAQRDSYRARHAKDIKYNDPTRAGLLSYYILWGDSPNIAQNIAAYRIRFSV
jgi:hypothetical protein